VFIFIECSRSASVYRMLHCATNKTMCLSLYSVPGVPVYTVCCSVATSKTMCLFLYSVPGVPVYIWRRSIATSKTMCLSLYSVTAVPVYTGVAECHEEYYVFILIQCFRSASV
jgi:hypothetical protein